VSNSCCFTPALLRTHLFVFFAVHETRKIFLSHSSQKAPRRVSSYFLTVQLSQSYGLTHRAALPVAAADDTQIYGASGPSDVGALLQIVTGCLTAVADWMSANRLQLNSDKTECMWLTSPRSQHRLPTSGPLIGANVVSPSATVRDLGVFIDKDLTMKTYVQQTASRCFPTLRQLRSIRRCIPTSVFHSLVSALVRSRLDYCNSLSPD